MEFRILGPLEAVDAGGEPVPLGGGKRRALLADLLLNVNSTVPVARLIDDLWGNAPPDTATKAVQIYVSQLRKALPERIVQTRSPGYILELAPERIDLYRFERLAREGREALASGEPEQASDLLSDALALWRGSALAEFEEPFAQLEAARIEELRLAALEERIEADLTSGRHAGLVGELDTLVRRQPLRERLRGQQMLALYRAGRQAEALACYQDFRRLLDEELGIEPSQPLRELERQILRQDAGLALSAEPSPPPRRAARTASPPGQSSAAVPTAVVGRDGELGGLRRLLDEALGGHRQIVFVSGQAGIGKTTLVEVFLAEIEAGGKVAVARGRCFEQYGAGEAYMPVLEALGRLCHGANGDAVIRILAEHAPSWLAQLPGHAGERDVPAVATSERMLRELVEAVERITADRPLLLLLEDLHWSDPSTVDVLGALARRDETARLLVLGTYRPGEARATEHPVWGVAQELRLRALASETSLGALPPRALVDYLDLRFPGNSFPIELPGLLHERTDGNPLFVQKVVDAWVDSGSIEAGDGTWQLGSSLAELAIDVPATVSQLIEHQIDQLDQETQQLVETASAAGMEFASIAVAAAAGRDPEEIEADCAELARQGRFFRALGEQSWPDGTVAATYGFVHDLYQEIAYSRLPPGRRARLHRELGACLEAAYGDRTHEIAAELAAHFVRGRDAERAVAYLRLAARQALARAGHHEAIEHLTNALRTSEALPATRERDEIEIAVGVELADALMEARGYAAPEVEEALTRARQLCARLGETPLLPHVLNGLSTIAEVSGRYAAALDLAEEFLRLAAGGPEDVLADARASLGWPLLCLGRLDEALQRLEPVVNDFEAERYRPVEELFGSSFPGIEARAVSAWALWLSGYPDKASTMSESAVELADELRHPFSVVYAVTCDAFVRQMRRERARAAERAGIGWQRAAELGLPLWEAWASIAHGWASDDEADDAIAEIRAGLDRSAATGAAWARTYLLALLAETYARSGQYDPGLQTLDEALAIVGVNDERFYEPELRRLRAELQLKLGRQEQAEAGFAEALEVARRLGATMLELRAAVSLGRLWRDQGRRDIAGELVSGVYARFTEGFDTVDLSEARELIEELGLPIPEPGSIVSVPGPAPAPGAAEVREQALPIVGREAELERLNGLLDDVLRGRRRVVLVTGDAGLGKTTLVEAFLARASGDGAIRVARGQCIEQHGAGEAYMPVLEALDRMCREPGGEELVAVLSERAPTWILHMPWLLSPAALESLSQRALGATTERMLREIVEALGAITVSRPLVLLLEDLHWSDASTLDLVSLLARRSDPARLLLLGTFRPREHGAVHPAQSLQELGLRGLATELALEALPADAVREYIASRLSGAELPPGVAGLLYERTGGNPLFMEAVVDAWIDTGRLQRRNGGWALESTMQELAVSAPPSLRRLIEHQLDRLEEEDQRLLEAASVAGREFSAALVAAACERDEGSTESRCAALAWSSSPIEARGTEEWPDGTVAGRYGFAHDLHQEVLYERIPPGRRARLHSRIGNRLEAAYGDRAAEIAPELAAHFVRGAEGERAVPHLRSAAEQSLSRSAPREAVDHLHAAMDVLSRLPEGPERDRAEAAVQARLGPALVMLEGWGSALAQQALDRAEALYRRSDDTAELARVLYNQATVHEVRADYRTSEQFVEQLLALPGSRGDDHLLLDSHELLACSLFHQGAFEPALDHADEGLGTYDGVYTNPLSAAFGDHKAVSCHTWAALSLWFLGLPEQAVARAREAIVLAESPSRRTGKALALVQAAIIAQCTLDAVQTREWAEAALDEATSRGFTYRIAGAKILRGWALAALGKTDEGLSELREGLEMSRRFGARMDDAYYGGLLADACCRAGTLDEGLHALDEALETVRSSRSFFYEAELHRLRGELRLRQGLASDGEASLTEAIEIARSQGAKLLELRAAVSLSRVHAQRGEIDAARELVRTAYATFSEGFGTHDLVAARALLEELGTTVPHPAGQTAERPPVRYARSGELSIAYQVSGGGPVDVVLVPGFVSHLEKDWEEPRHARFLDRLGSFSRLIRFDKRGTGLSDRPGEVPDLETRMDDVRAVMDAAGSEQPVLFGYSEGGPLSLLFAATHPERVAALVLYGAFAKRIDPDEDYPWAPTREKRSARIEAVTTDWGLEAHMRAMCPSADDALARWWGERCRAAASPGAVRLLMEMNSRIDVREILGTIAVPTLVVHRAGDVSVDIGEGRYISERIPGARFVELHGVDHFVAIDPDQILDAVEPFVNENASAAPADPGRVLATVVVTDIVGSTETAARLGDAAWSSLLSRHHDLVREELGRFSGEEIDTAGDGFLALFDGPSRAIRCSLAVRRRLTELGLAVRVGVHTGEVERAGPDVRGIAVHVAARVAAAAEPGEVLVTATTHDIVAGSGLAFDDRGERALKGFDAPRRLFAAEA